MKKPIECDVECYVDYFLIKFRDDETGAVMEFEQYPGRTFNKATVRKILLNYTIFTFNGNNYDMPMIALALRGATCAELKEASDWIVKGGMKPWKFCKHYGVKVATLWDHIDLYEVAPGTMDSLKIYGARMHAATLQDLPVPENAEITPEQRPVLRKYCGNDLKITAMLRKALKDEIELREAMSLEYGIDLRSKSDAQVAEHVIKKKVSQLIGTEVQRNADFSTDRTFKYKVPPFIRFITPEMNELLDRIREAEFELDGGGKPKIPASLRKVIQLGAAKFKLGVGGLHSQEKSTAHAASADYELHDDDATSFYPWLIYNAKMFPAALGPHFLGIYKDILDKRVMAKQMNNKKVANSMKIMLNGTFGKLGSPYSIFYAPDLLIQVTVTGQLVLLMMIEMFVQAGIEVISANTDGVVTKVHWTQRETKRLLIQAWERQVGMTTENTRYLGLYSRDVNNYLAVKLDSDTKGKGVFTSTGLMKSPANQIIPTAVSAFLANGTPLEDTIRGCTDIRQFVSARQVNGGALLNWELIGKAVRWYRSTASTSHLEYKLSGNKVPLTDNCVPVMELPSELPADIDYDWYIQEARDLLYEVGHGPRVEKVTKRRKKAEVEEQEELFA